MIVDFGYFLFVFLGEKLVFWTWIFGFSTSFWSKIVTIFKFSNYHINSKPQLVPKYSEVNIQKYLLKPGTRTGTKNPPKGQLSLLHKTKRWGVLYFQYFSISGNRGEFLQLLRTNRGSLLKSPAAHAFDHLWWVQHTHFSPQTTTAAKLFFSQTTLILRGSRVHLPQTECEQWLAGVTSHCEFILISGEVLMVCAADWQSTSLNGRLGWMQKL